MSIEWTRREVGWYTSEIGSIAHESDGWCFFPTALIPHIGPFKTFKEAKKQAEAHSKTTSPALASDQRG